MTAARNVNQRASAGEPHGVPPSGGSAANNPSRVDLPAPNRLNPGLHAWTILSDPLRSLPLNPSGRLTTENAERGNAGEPHVVPPSGGNASNNPTRADLPAPNRLKPGLHAWTILSDSLRSLSSLRLNRLVQTVFGTCLAAVVALLASTSHAEDQVSASSARYLIWHRTLDLGGGRTHSASFDFDTSLGGFGGTNRTADNRITFQLGRVGFLIADDQGFNRTPSISAIANQNGDGGSTPLVSFTVGDFETPAGDLRVTGTSSDPVLIPSNSIRLGGSGVNRNVQMLSPPTKTGTAIITLVVTDAEGAQATIQFTVTVNVPAPKLIPEILWAAPASIGFGTALGPSQLNATANVPGTFSYTPANGTLPNAGTANLSVTFTPGDAANYQTATKTVSLTVAKAPLTIRADNKFKREGEVLPVLTAVYTGFVNQDTSASLDVPLVLSTTAIASSATGSYPITASGAADVNYAITHVNGTLTVTTLLLPKITWSNPPAITYGIALGSAQLNATADVAGSFSYTPALGTVLGAGQGRVLSVTFTPNDLLNYERVTVTVGIDVLKAPLTVRAGDKTKVYGAELPTLTATVSGFVNGNTVASLATPVSLSTPATASSNAGTYAITPGGATDANYTIAFEPGTLTVTKAALTIQAEAKSKAYGAALSALTAVFTGFVNGDTAASLDSPVSLSTTATATSGVGTYPITASGASDVNYTIALEAGTFTVAKAPLTIRAEDKTKAFRAALPLLTASYTGFVNQDTVASLDVPLSLSTSATASSNVGTYAITAGGASDANYAITFEPGTVTVTQAVLTIRAEDKTKIYGAAMPTFTASYTGFIEGDTASDVDSPVILSTTASASSNVGNYGITASGAKDANYTIVFEPGTLTVTRALLAIRAENQSKVYGAALPALTGSYTGFVNGDTAASLDQPLALTTAAAPSSNVGTYPITASGASDANYTISFEPGTLTLSPAPLKIRAEDKFKKLDDALPQLTAVYTGFVNQDTPANLDVPVALSTTASASSAVGSYPITASAAADANYTITHVNGTLRVTTKLVPVVTWANPASITYGTALGVGQLNATADVAGSISYNPPLGAVLAAGQGRLLSATFTPNDTSAYDTVTVAVGIVVLRAPLTIRAENKSKVYGADAPALTVTYGGFVNADGAASLDSGVSLSTTATATSSVGSYPITASGANDANYTITFEPGTLTVTKASLTVRAEDKSKVYGAALPVLTAKFAGFVNQDTASSLDTAATLSATATAASNVGTYAITASGARANNYTIAFEPGTLTVLRAPLTIRAENQTKVYGAALPTLTAGYIGFVNGDTAASLDSAAILTTTATASAIAGTYPITVHGAGDGNYAIVFEPGTLAVTRALLTIRAEDKAKVYGAALPTFTASYTGFVNADTIASLGSPVILSVGAKASSRAGAYAITPNGASHPNYAMLFEAGTLTITKAALTLRVDDKTKVYGAALPGLTASYTGLVNGDTAVGLENAGTFSTAATASSNVGAYPITATGANDANYTIAFEPATLTVTKAALTIRAESKFKRLGDALPPLTAVYSGFVQQDTPESLDVPAVLSTTANASSPVGNYPITAVGAADANYVITHLAGTLTVTAKLAPKITWANPATIVYGTALSPSQLNATADVAGTFSYNPPAGAVLSAGQGRFLTAAFTPSDTTGYEPVTAVVGIDVLKAPLTIRAEGKTKVYGAALPALTATYSGFVNQDSAASLDSPVSLRTTTTASSNAGSYPITASDASDANYAISFESGTLSVIQAPLTIRAENKTKLYGAGLPTLTAGYIGFVNQDTPTSLDSPVSLTTSATAGSNAGSYPINAGGATDANYSIVFAPGALTVGKVPLTIRAENKTKGFRAPLPALTAVYLGFVNQDSPASLDTPVSVSTDASAASGVGIYAIAAGGASDANYVIAFEPGTLTVTKAVLTIRAENKTKAYGAAMPALTASFTGFIDGETASSLDSPAVLSTTASASSGAGIYGIIASGAKDANYAILFELGTLTVTPVPLVIRAEDRAKGYGAAMPALTANYIGFVNGDTAASLDRPVVLTTAATASSRAGAYPILAGGAADADYTISFEPGTLAVSKASLTIRAENKFKKTVDAVPLLTAVYTGFVNQDTPESLDVAVTLSTPASASSPVGNYPIVAAGASDSDYAIKHLNGTLTVSAKLLPRITWSNPSAITYGTALGTAQLNAAADVAGRFSYNPPLGTILAAGQGKFLAATFTPNDTATHEPATVVVGLDVLPAPLTIRAEDKAKVYGASLPVLTANYSGFVNQDTATSLDSSVSLSTTAAVASDAGTYPITAGGASDANYAITFEPGTLTVSKAALTIRAEDKSTVYGAALPVLTATYSGLVNQNTAANLDTPVNLTTSATSASNAGAYSITAGGAVDNNYTILFEAGTLTVSKAALTIRAEDKSKAYGASLPALTAAYSGLVNLDTETSLDSPVTLSTTATASSGVGTFAITGGGASDANYTITVEPGTLTVVKAALTIRAEDKTKGYGAALPVLTTAYSGFVNGETASSLDSPVSLSTSAVASSNAGTYSITPSGASDANYSVTYEPGTLTVTRAALTIRAENMTKVYGAALPTLTATYTGFVNGDSAGSLDSPVALTTAATASSNTGSYAVNAVGADDVNYTITLEPGTLTVTTASLTVRAEDKFHRQGDALPLLTAVYTGFVNQDTPESLDVLPTLGTAVGATSPVGSYPITASGTADGNYIISHVNGTLTVTARQVPRVAWANLAPITYGTALSSAQLNATADVPGFFSYSPASGTVLAAGQGKSLAATFTPNDTVNYEILTVVVGIDVFQAPLTIRAESLSKVYGAALPVFTVAYTGFVNEDSLASLDSPVGLSTTATASSSAGTYPITPDGASDANYAIVFEPGILTVTKATLTIRAESKTNVYGATLSALTASYTGLVNQDTAANLDNPVSLSTTGTTASNVGTYPITASSASDANYTITFEQGTLTVSKAPLTIRADDKTVVYGSGLPGLTVTYSGFVNQDTDTSLDSPVGLSTTAVATSNAGTYPISASGARDANYTITLLPGTLTISKAALTVRADDQSKGYGAALPTLTASYSGFVNGNTTSSLDNPVSLSTSATASSAAGNYPITVGGVSAVNYTITVVEGTLIVTRAALTIRAEDTSKVYGATLPALTTAYTGFVNGDTAASLDRSVSLSTAATASSGVGSYPIVVSGATDANYTIAFEPGTLRVTQAALAIRAEDKYMKLGDSLPVLTAVYTGFVNQDTPESLDVPLSLSTTASASSPVGSYPITASGANNANYAITQANGTLTVTAKSVPRITWANPAPIAYGTVLGTTQLNATADVAGSFSYNPPLGAVLTAGQGSLLSATFIPSATGDYESVTAVVGIDVLKVSLTVRAEDHSKVYGASLPTLTASYTGFVTGDTATSLDSPVSLSSTGTASSSVGTYSINASGASDANYTISFEAGALSVTKAALTIRAEDKSKAYGAALPALTAVFTGFANADTEASLDSAVSMSTTGTASSSAGSYPINVGGASDANYTILFAPGTLTVAKAALTIRAENLTKAYGAAVPPLTARYTGFLNQDTPASLDTPVTLSTIATPASSVGDYLITANGASDANYTIGFEAGTMTVAKTALTIRGENKTKAYGAAMPTLTVSYTGFVNQDTSANLDSPVSLSTTARASSSAGAYPITVSGASDANYAITFETGILTVAKVPLTIRAENKSKVYGAPLPTLTAIYSGFINQDTVVSLDSPASLTTPATASSGVGTYPIVGSGARDANYEISFEVGTLTITHAALTVRAEDKSKKVGEALPRLTASYSGFVNQDTVESLNARAALSTTASASSPAGSYPIVISGTADDNYTISGVNGTLTVTAKLTPRVGWANAAPIVYGTALGAAQLNATAEVAGSFSYSPAPGTVLAAGQGQVLTGTFTPNDAITYDRVTVSVSVDVLKAPLVIRAENKSVVYGAAAPALTATYIGFVNQDTAASLDSPVSLSTSATASSSVGSYSVKADGASDANYTIAFQSGTLTVTQAALSVTPKTITRRLNTPNPSLTGIIRGLKNNDSISAVYSTTAVDDSPVGTYPITATLVDSDRRLANYTVTIEAASLTVQLESTFAGVAQDGYVADALVFFDANKSGAMDANEPSTRTDSRGTFDLVVLVQQFDTNGNGVLDPAEGRLVLLGGVDISTGLPLQTSFTAPPGSTVLNPLTTLLSATIDNNPTLTVAESKAKLNQALGISPSIELTTYDPLAAAADNDGRAKEVLSAGAKVQDTLLQISALMAPGDAASKSQAASAVIQAIASSVTAGTSINLDQPAVVNSLIQQSATRLGQEVSTQVKDGASQIIAGANQVKTAIVAATGNALDVAEELSRTQVVGQAVTAVLAQVTSGAVSMAQATVQSSKEAITQSAQTAQVGDVLGVDERPGTFFFSKTAYPAPVGASAAPVVLNRSGGNFGDVTVVISLKSPNGSVAGTVPVLFKSREMIKTVDLSSQVAAAPQLSQQESVPLTLALAAGSLADSALGTPAAATLTVRIAPQIVQQPSGRDVTRGSTVTLAIVATGTPVPAYQWQRNGINLPGQVSASLTINSVADADSGTYRVVVNNTGGTITSAAAEVRVLSAPIIVQQPGGQDLARGGSVTMSVVATGTPAPSYQWQKNGINIPGQSAASLSLNFVTETDSGRYQVVVSNSAGAVVSANAEVFVVSTPVITNPLLSQTLILGETLKLEIQVSGNALRFEWEKDGVVIPNASQPLFTRTNAQESDSGAYRVRVINVAGTVMSGEAIIRVFRPVVFQVQPEGRSVQAGLAVKLSAKADGTGPLTYQWFRDGSLIVGAKTNELTLNPVQLSDAGTYNLTVTSPFASVASVPARLEVFAPAAITSNPLGRTVFAGDDVKFAIEVSGSQPISYQWYRDSTLLPGGRGQELTLKTVQTGDSGQYWAQVSNTYGTASSVRADLVVIGMIAPTIAVQPRSQTVFQGTNVIFEVVAIGTAPLSYQWSKDGAAIIGATTNRLERKNVKPSDAGDYAVVVSNQAGGVLSLTAILKVEKIVVRGDFDGDGIADIVFENDGGFLGFWSMKGTELARAGFLEPPTTGDPKWRVVGNGDWNGDSNEDLLFQHEDGTLAVWFMKGTALDTAALLKPSNPGDSRWRIVGTGDMNGDGQRDIVFQHEDGSLATWLMKGIEAQDAKILEPANPGDAQWKVAVIGDIDGDGKEDLVFQHQDGTLAVWFMDRTKLLRASLLNPEHPGPSWRVVGAVDWNRDGKCDLLLQSRVDSSLAVWLMNGAQLINGLYLTPSSPGGTWKAVVPR